MSAHAVPAAFLIRSGTVAVPGTGDSQYPDPSTLVAGKMPDFLRFVILAVATVSVSAGA
jgi:hypothetical protein